MTVAIATDIGREYLDAAIAALSDPEHQNSLIERYVRRDSVRRGRHAAKVEVGNAAVSVWALIGHLRGGGGTHQTAQDYALPEEAVIAAVAYYARNRSYIDAKLLLNDDFFDDVDLPDLGRD